MKKAILLIVLICTCLLSTKQAFAQTFMELNSQFMALFNKEAYKEAIPIGIKALAMAKKEYGEDNINYAISANNLAHAYYSNRQPSESLPYFHTARRSYRAVYKTLAVAKIAYCDNMIGQVYNYQKKYDSSAIFLEKAFDYFVYLPDEHYEDALVVMNNLSDLYLPQKKHKEAQKVFEIMTEAILKKEGFKGDNFKFTFYNLLLMMHNQSNHAGVDTLCQMLLPIIGEQLGKKSSTYAYTAFRYGNALYELKRPDSALKYLLQALPTLSAVTTDGYITANCNNVAGLVYLDKKKYDSSEHYLKKSFNYFLSHYQEDYNDLVLLSENLAVLYFANNRFSEHIAMLQKLLPIIEKTETALSENYCRNVYYLLIEYKQSRDFVNGETWGKKLVALREKLNSKKSKEYTQALDAYANNLTEMNRAKEAEPLLLQSLAIKKAFPQQDTLELGMTHIMLGNCYGKQARYSKSYNSYNTAIALFEKAKLTNTENYTVALKSLAYTYVEGTRFSDAKALLKKLLSMQTDNEGENFSGNADLLVTLGNAEYQLNELNAAQEHANKALVIAVKNFGENYPIVANAKELLGFLQHRFGNSTKGIDFFKEALAINKQTFGEESNEYASTLSNIGVVYMDIGYYVESEIALQKSVAIRGRVLGKEHPYYGLSIMNLAMIYSMQANYSKAVGMLKDAMDIYTKKMLTQSPIFIKIINNLAYNISGMGAYKEAKELYVKTLGLIDTTNSDNFYPRYLLLNNLSVACLGLKENEDATKYAQQAMSYVKKEQGEKCIEYIKSANNLFIAYKQSGHLVKAKQIVNAIIPICKEVLGNEAELLGTLYINASLLANQQNNLSEAASKMKLGLDIVIKTFRRNFYTLSEKEKLIWYEEQGYLFNLHPSLLMQFPNFTQDILEDVIDVQLQLKGFVMNNAASALKKVRASGSKQLNSLIDEWQATRTLLSKQFGLPLLDRYLNTDSLENVANNLEKQINQQSKGLIAVTSTKNNTWKDVQSRLKDKEAAVEYINFPFYRGSEYTDSTQYAAIVITKNKPPQFVPLATEKQIAWTLTGDSTESNKQTKINSLYRSSIKGAINNKSSFVGDSLYSLVWKPLRPYLQNATTIYYAPDGLLHKVAFHALPTGNNKLLLDDVQLQQFSTTRQLAEQSNEQDKWTSAYIMGNADFNMLSNAGTSTSTGTVTFSRSKDAAAWSGLPGTEKEISTLKPLFESKQIKVSLTSKSNATEENFKALDKRSPSIIHLATHGFFLPLQKFNKKIDINMLEEVDFASNEDPLLRSGIIMAGANKAWSGEPIPSNMEDGIVTAYEIAQMDLSNTKLVVLSACETALGDVQGTEGVFGLQRAFKMAGAKNLIVSLWQVPDKETAELMTIFYNKLFTGITAREAFYQAQKEMRAKYPPYLWAAFVLVE